MQALLALFDSVFPLFEVVDLNLSSKVDLKGGSSCFTVWDGVTIKVSPSLVNVLWLRKGGELARVTGAEVVGMLLFPAASMLWILFDRKMI